MRLSPVLAVVLAGVAAGPSLAADDIAAPSAVAATIPTVTVATATRAEVQGRVPLSGTLVARQVVQVYPQVAGLEIEALSAEPGDRVTRGQELARLSDATVAAQLAQADAELQRAVAGISQAESQISSAEAARTQAVTALERARALRRSGSGSQAALDQAVAAEAAAQAQAASANDGLAVARATQAQAQAARDIAQLNLDRTRIVAPVDGRVTARGAQLGGVASAAGDPMFTLIADGTIEFEGEVIESALPDLQPGDPAELQVAGVGRISGEVRQLPAAVDPTTRLGLVRVALPPDDRLLTGLFASGDIITVRREAVTVPSTAVLSDGEGERVQVVRDGVVDTRPVTGGLLWQGMREILDGLAEGEQVITRAGAFFSSGDAVNAVTAAAPGTAAAAADPNAAPEAAPDAAPDAADAGLPGDLVTQAGSTASPDGPQPVPAADSAAASAASGVLPVDPAVAGPASSPAAAEAAAGTAQGGAVTQP